MADLVSGLQEIIDSVEAARAVPLSASCVVNREELLDALGALLDELPEEVRSARALLAERDEVLAAGQRAAQALLADAAAERARLVADSEVAREAGAQAAQVLDDAHAEAQRLRRDVDDYVDARLATFEVVLHKTLGTVERGRDRLRGRSELDELAPVDSTAEPVAHDARRVTRPTLYR